MQPVSTPSMRASRRQRHASLWTVTPQLARYLHVTVGQLPGASIHGMSSSGHSDVELSCTCCGQRFVYTAGEQELHAVRGVVCRPRECPTCRRLLGHL